jgi:hypothetical protein
MQYTITNIDQEHFNNVSRLTAKNTTEEIIIDVHNNFLKFFKSPIGSTFNLSIEQEIPENLSDVSYIMKGYPINDNIISGSGLLLHSVHIPHTPHTPHTPHNKHMYVVIKV